jgi:hypothetical protein
MAPNLRPLDTRSGFEQRVFRIPTEPPCVRREPRCKPTFPGAILARMRFEKIWVKQCNATKGIRRRFGAKSTLDYLIGEKLITFAEEAERRPEFAKELPRFLAAIWQAFNQYELAGYVASQKPAPRKHLRKLLYMK